MFTDVLGTQRQKAVIPLANLMPPARGQQNTVLLKAHVSEIAKIHRVFLIKLADDSGHGGCMLTGIVCSGLHCAGKLLMEATQGSSSEKLLSQAPQGSYSEKLHTEAIQGSYSEKLLREAIQNLCCLRTLSRSCTQSKKGAAKRKREGCEK